MFHFITKHFRTPLKQKWFFILFMLFNFNLKAQLSVGFGLGPSLNNINTDFNNISNTASTAKVGLAVTLPVQMNIIKSFYLELAPGFVQKNYAIERTGMYAGIYETYKNTYLQFPINIGYTIGKAYKFFVTTGMYGGYWLRGNVQGDIADIYSVSTNTGSPNTQTFKLVSYNQHYQFNNKTDNRLEYGITMGTGIKHAVSTKLSLFLKLVYYQSFSDHQKEYMINQIPVYNQTIVFSAGIIKDFGEIVKKLCAIK